jgi:hypothetical protein
MFQGYRTGLSKVGIPASPIGLQAWNWWVPGCFNGLVPAEQVLASRSDDVFGANGGAGLTFKMMENGRFGGDLRHGGASGPFQLRREFPVFSFQFSDVLSRTAIEN